MCLSGQPDSWLPYPEAMAGTLALLFLVSGIVLFVIGDFLWLIQVTMSRPMNVRVTGGLVLGGVVLIAIGLLIAALS